MPEFRQDPVTGEWIIIADNRASRPLDFAPREQPSRKPSDRPCPFCVGNESKTPSAVATIENGTASCDWSVRVVPNLYEAVQPDVDFLPFDEHATPSLRNSTPAWGYHEVIVESPKHVQSLTQIAVENVEDVVFAYRQRYRELSRTDHVKFVMVFKNCGEKGGISLEHIHSQLVAFHHVPNGILAELSGSLAWLQENNSCVFCDMVADELEQGERVIMADDHFVAFCPFASRFPYETWIVPREHSARFEMTSDQQLQSLAAFYQQVLKRIELSIPNVAYNCIFHSSPFDSKRYDHYHWHIEVIPRIATLAGLEIGARTHVNIVKPEQSAKLLR